MSEFGQYSISFEECKAHRCFCDMPTCDLTIRSKGSKGVIDTVKVCGRYTECLDALEEGKSVTDTEPMCLFHTHEVDGTKCEMVHLYDNNEDRKGKGPKASNTVVECECNPPRTASFGRSNKENANKGRCFFGCPSYSSSSGEKCDFFRWFEKATYLEDPSRFRKILETCSAFGKKVKTAEGGTSNYPDKKQRMTNTSEDDEDDRGKSLNDITMEYQRTLKRISDEFAEKVKRLYDRDRMMSKSML